MPQLATEAALYSDAAFTGVNAPVEVAVAPARGFFDELDELLDAAATLFAPAPVTVPSAPVPVEPTAGETFEAGIEIASQTKTAAMFQPAADPLLNIGKTPIQDGIAVQNAIATPDAVVIREAITTRDEKIEIRPHSESQARDAAMMVLARQAATRRPSGPLSFAARIYSDGASDPRQQQAAAKTTVKPAETEAAAFRPATQPAANSVEVKSPETATPKPEIHPEIRKAADANHEPNTPRAAKFETVAFAREEKKNPDAVIRPISNARADVSWSGLSNGRHAESHQTAAAAEPAPSASAAAMIEELSPPERIPGPVRQIALELGNASESVRLNVVERRGEVHISVHTSDESLGASLKKDLGELVQQVEQSGLKAETWTSAAAASEKDSSNSYGSRERGEDAQQQQRSSSDEQKQNQKREQSRPCWYEELTRTLNCFGKEQEVWLRA